MIRYKRDEKMESGLWGDGGVAAAYVMLDGAPVGVVRKRTEWYGNIGHRGARYTYYDFFRVNTNGEAVREPNPENRRGGSSYASGSTRKVAVAHALVLLGYLDAAREVDHATAEHYARQQS